MSGKTPSRKWGNIFLLFNILLITTVFINVTVYAVTANTVIQAQNWNTKNGSVFAQSGVAPDGTSIGNIAAGDWVRYNGVDFGTGGYNTFMAYLAVDSTNAGKVIEIRLDASNGTLIGSITVASTGSFSIFKEQYASLSNVTGLHDVYLVFPSAMPANIDWFVFSKYSGSETTTERDQRMQWWREARFGQFIHWGAYSYLAGVFRGTPTGGAGEWIMNDLQISRANYEADAATQFNPVNFNAQQWVTLCKNAGQKYMVITSKHHEGFSMFDTAVAGFKGESSSTLYSIMHFGPYTGQDPMAALSQECKNQGVKFCFYYSIMDWHHSTQSGWNPTTMLSGQKDTYVTQMKEQLEELIVKYDPEVLWFDGEWVSWWTTADGQAVYRFLRTLKPSLIINNRVGKRAQTDGDFGTPEQEIPATGLSYDWETCMTMNNTWGFKTSDTSWKSTATLINNLAQVASKGGNYLLNIGPDGLGVTPQASIDRLTEMGQWLSLHGESIYATRATCFPDIPVWGYCTTKTGKLYLHVFSWPGNGQLNVPRIANQINRIYLLSNPAVDLAYTLTSTEMVITVPGTAPNQYDSVVVVDCADDPAPIPSLTYNKPTTVSNYYQNDPAFNGAKAVDENLTTRWATNDGITSAWLEVDFGANTAFNKTVTKECIDYGQRVAGYKIQYWNGSSWIDAYTGTTIGSSKTDSFLTVTGSKVRLNITSVTGAQGPTIWEFMVYNENPQTINDTASGITYSGWGNYSSGRGCGDINDDVHYATSNGSYFQYTFNGTGVDYVAEKYTDEGNVDIYLDGLFQQTVNCYNSSRLARQIVYSKTGLTNGSHTIKGVKMSGQYALLDALRIYQDTAPPTSTPTPGGPTATPTPSPTPAPTAFFSDGFESNNFTAGGWTNSGCTIGSNYKYAGTYAAIFNSSDSLTKVRSTAGYKSIQVSYARYSRNCETDDYFIAEWYNGSAWTTLESVPGNFSWTVKTWSLPTAAENNANFQIRFKTSHNGSSDYAYFDEVKIIGTPL